MVALTVSPQARRRKPIWQSGKILPQNAQNTQNAAGNQAVQPEKRFAPTESNLALTEKNHLPTANWRSVSIRITKN